jgi:hypothetical protein
MKLPYYGDRLVRTDIMAEDRTDAGVSPAHNI